MSGSSASKANEQVKAFKEWISTIREDTGLLKAIVSSSSFDRDARIHAAAALNYLVSRMDLVPDWEESVGLVDDLMVMRMCVELASKHRLDEDLEEPAHMVVVGRLLNDIKQIEDFLGSELSAELRDYCAKLKETPVRGRSCSILVENEDERRRLFDEVDQDIERMPSASFADPEALVVKLKSYLAHKLKN